MTAAPYYVIAVSCDADSHTIVDFTPEEMAGAYKAAFAVTAAAGTDSCKPRLRVAPVRHSPGDPDFTNVKGRVVCGDRLHDYVCTHSRTHIDDGHEHVAGDGIRLVATWADGGFAFREFEETP